MGTNRVRGHVFCAIRRNAGLYPAMHCKSVQTVGHIALKQEENQEAALLQTVAMLSTLLTALEVRFRTSERRAGRDPSDQEEPLVAKAYLGEGVADLEDLLMQLSTSAAITANHDEDYIVAAVRRFDDLMMLNQAGVLLQSIHQRLLSLYPAVREALVEEARLLQHVQREVSDSGEEVYRDRLVRFVERGLALTNSIHRELLGRR